jgi:hypothetical protein
MINTSRYKYVRKPSLDPDAEVQISFAPTKPRFFRAIGQNSGEVDGVEHMEEDLQRAAHVFMLQRSTRLVSIS